MLPAISPQAQQQISELITDPTGQISTYPFTANIAGELPPDIRKAIYRWMLKNYIWPQVQERRPYERQWDKLLMMARAAYKYSSRLMREENSRMRKRRKRMEKKLSKSEPEEESSVMERLEISDTLIFDCIDRLCNLNHFIAFKESFPVRYEIPEDMVFPYENESYSPMSNLVRSANCWLRFNANQAEIYRKGWMTARHHYTYGVSFVSSQYYQKIEYVQRRIPATKQFQPKPELTEIGITFEPLSIRKLWLNSRLPVYRMAYQVCPFYFDEVPRFAIIANQYDKDLNPFGYSNTESLPNAQYLFQAVETNSWYQAWSTTQGEQIPISNLLDPEYAAELKWTLFPMLPIGQDENLMTDENPYGWVFDEDGTKKIPLTRWIMEMFGNNITTGEMEIIRMQRNFYPREQVPLYGSAHMPTLDDGTYSMAIGTILENHYEQICRCIIQYMDNKDWVNDPAIQVMHSSPAMALDLNVLGKKIAVNSQNDIKHREVFDATQTTPAFLGLIRDQAQTSSKTVDAIMGKAMGSRTSATEASNIFQTAMSGVTTDINLFSFDIFGGYATRVWEFTGYWVDPDVLCAITGSYGFTIRPDYMALRLGLKFDVGSAFIESLTRQQNYRYLLETTAPGDPSINRAYLYRELLKEWKMKNVDKIVNDMGMEQQIMLATEQAITTYYGGFVMIDPDQNHEAALRVKKSFLADPKSVWNRTYGQNAKFLIPQMQQHMAFIQLQQLQMQAMAEQQMARESLMQAENAPPARGPNPSPGSSADTPGKARQKTGK